MSRVPYGKITLIEKLSAVLNIVILAMTLAYTLVRYLLVTDPRTQPTLDRELNRMFTRTLLTRFSPAQLHWMVPQSTPAYKTWIETRARKEDAPVEVVTEIIGNDGAKLHWIGRKDARKIMIHFPSGGFVLPFHSGHLSLLNYFRREVKRRSNTEVKAAIVEYTLSPFSPYPTQFQQAVRAIRHLTDSGVSPADILITGDSAGGMLGMQILSHFLHPHPSIPSMPIPPIPFAGILAISPWLKFDSDAASFMNNDKDGISGETLLRWGGIMRGNSPTKVAPEVYWREPLTAPHGWWHGSGQVTKHFMFTYGEYEGMRDDILSFVDKFSKDVSEEKVDISTVSDPMGVHIAPILDALRPRTPTRLTESMAEWINDRFIV